MTGGLQNAAYFGNSGYNSVDYGSGDSDIGNDCHFGADCICQAVAAGIKSNDCRRDVSYECMGSYDAGVLT